MRHDAYHSDKYAFDSNYKSLSDKQQFRRTGFSHGSSDATNLNLAWAMGH
jgi:hypothetical protein